MMGIKGHQTAGEKREESQLRNVLKVFISSRLVSVSAEAYSCELARVKT